MLASSVLNGCVHPPEDTANMSMGSGQPHEALFLVLPYLSVSELIAVGTVCISLRKAVHEDVLPWLELVIDGPLSRRLSDATLLKIASKAGGRLQSLGLFNCMRITDAGLRKVVENNPLINKLYLPGCTNLTPEGVIGALKTLSTKGKRLQSLKIRGIYNLRKEHLQELESYVGANPNTFRRRSQHLSDQSSANFDRSYSPIDVEICPRCDEVRIVFDCPRGSCARNTDGRLDGCRGCSFCIPRCVVCSRCVTESDDPEEAEAICMDTLCTSCWLRLPKCSFCNRPYCNRHAELQFGPLRPREFICDSCSAPHSET